MAESQVQDVMNHATGWKQDVTMPASISDAERAEAERVARRLHSELRGVVESLPDSERGASAMSRALQMDRATCQRIVGAVMRGSPDAETLVQLPGVLGLRQFIEAVGKRADKNAELLVAASAAVDRFESLLDSMGGSQRRFRERLTSAEHARVQGSESSTYIGADDVGAREALFRAAAAITGRWSEANIAIRIVRPTPGDPRLTEELLVRGHLGHAARAEAAPLVIGSRANLESPAQGVPAYSMLDSTPSSGDAARSLLEPFCSSPLPKVIARTAGQSVVHVIDTPDGQAGKRMDLVVANRSGPPEPHPATLRPAMGELWQLATFPSRRMVFDVYLHRDIARRCMPNLEVHLWNPDINRQGSSRWSTRLPGGPRLSLLGQGISASATESHARHKELTAHVFAQVGWDSAEFVGYRCEVAYPIWRAGYCMSFDFTGNEM